MADKALGSGTTRLFCASDSVSKTVCRWANDFFANKKADALRAAAFPKKEKPSERSAKENTLAILSAEFVLYRKVLKTMATMENTTRNVNDDFRIPCICCPILLELLGN